MQKFNPEINRFDIGATAEFSLRVSAAALVRVIFEHPRLKQTWLALERTAAAIEISDKTEVVLVAKPFGGGLRLIDPQALQVLIGNFHFDSRRSHDEMDFRLMIRPQDWDAVRDFCLQHLLDADGVLETSPERELKEEFADALGFIPDPNQYLSRSLGSVIENEPLPTISRRSPGTPTVRIYHVSEINIFDLDLINAILINNQKTSALDRKQSASNRTQPGAKGWVHGVLALPLDALLREYQPNPAQESNNPVIYEGHFLDDNVLAVLPEVESSKYQRIQLVR